MAKMSTTSKRGLLLGGVLLAVLVTGYVVANLWLSSDDAPVAFESTDLTSEADDTSSGPSDTASADQLSSPPSGVWTVAIQGDQDAGIGYRILEDVPIGGPEEVAARTEAVTGSVTVDGGQLSSTEISVDMTTLASGNEIRDQIVADNYLQVGEFPTATFTLTEPFTLPTTAGPGELAGFELEGELTLHGQTQPVVVTGEGQWTAEQIEIVGVTDISLSSFGVERPDLLGRTAHDEAMIEFKVQFEPVA